MFVPSYGQIARSVNNELVYAAVADEASGGQATNSIGIIYEGTCQLHDLVVAAPLGSQLDLALSSPMSSLTENSDTVKIHIAETCPRGKYLTVSGVCEQCAANKYLLNFEETAECQTCPDGAVCIDGQLTTKKDWWRTNLDSDQIWPCPLAEACSAGSSNSSDICTEGYTGVQCGVCAADYYFVTSTSTCAACTGMQAETVLTAAGIFAIVITALALCLGKARMFINARRWLKDVVWDVHKFKASSTPTPPPVIILDPLRLSLRMFPNTGGLVYNSNHFKR